MIALNDSRDITISKQSAMALVAAATVAVHASCPPQEMLGPLEDGVNALIDTFGLEIMQTCECCGNPIPDDDAE